MKKYSQSYSEFLNENLILSNDSLKKDIYTIPGIKTGMSLNVSNSAAGDENLKNVEIELDAVLNKINVGQSIRGAISKLTQGRIFKEINAVIVPIVQGAIDAAGTSSEVKVDIINKPEVNNVVDPFIQKMEVIDYVFTDNKYSEELKNTIIKSLRRNFAVIPLFQTSDDSKKYNTDKTIIVNIQTVIISNNGKPVSLKIYDKGTPIDFRPALSKMADNITDSIDAAVKQDILRVIQLGKTK
jgi:hypothetical protein